MKYQVFFLFLVVLLSQANSCDKKSEKPVPKPCLERARFGDPQNSPYALPYPAGKSYVLSQSYCNPNGGHSNQLAYDFALSVGDTVTAARSGVVKEIREEVPDTGTNPDPGAHNHVFIQHADGSVAFYAHLKQNAVLVEVGQTVEAGQAIALSGNSGNTASFPHLHFGVYEEWPAVEGYDLPINFNNAEGPLDVHGGLITDQWYKALVFLGGTDGTTAPPS